MLAFSNHCTPYCLTRHLRMPPWSGPTQPQMPSTPSKMLCLMHQCCATLNQRHQRALLQMPLKWRLEQSYIQQCIDSIWSPIAYFSRKLCPAETRYSTYDCELLAIYLAIKQFRNFVEGRSFHIITDHKPLIFALSTKPRHQSPRQIRHLDFIGQFTSDIRYIKGSANLAADALSRIEVDAVHTPPVPGIDFKAMAEAQHQGIPHNGSLQLQELPAPTTDATLQCDMSTGTPRPYVPQQFRQSVFDSLHNLSHPGIRGTQRLIASRYVSPGMNADIRQWARTCLQCQRSKVH